jgi:hypothetical protein
LEPSQQSSARDGVGGAERRSQAQIGFDGGELAGDAGRLQRGMDFLKQRLELIAMQ